MVGLSHSLEDGVSPRDSCLLACCTEHCSLQYKATLGDRSNSSHFLEFCEALDLKVSVLLGSLPSWTRKALSLVVLATKGPDKSTIASSEEGAVLLQHPLTDILQHPLALSPRSPPMPVSLSHAWMMVRASSCSCVVSGLQFQDAQQILPLSL